VLGVDGDRAGRCVDGREPGFEGFTSEPSRPGDLAGGDRRGLLGFGDAGVEEEQLGPAVGDHAGDGLGRRRRRDRGHGDAGAQAAEEHRRIGDRRQGADGDGLARRDAVALQGGGDAVDQGVELGVGDRSRRFP
jgi:hypothetical protein